ncbi:hypothetical protein [Streptomyces sp. NPDC096323]|uniref:hypothetical protein n=1 Tax=Streptomyces sp. NPDC096323 TaxID=3155822 RepID=UPI00332A537D
MEDDVKACLESGGAESMRMYSAACAERMAQIFIGHRSADTDRQEDVDLYVEILQRLWNPDDAMADFADVVSRIEAFPEMQPTDTGLTDSVDIHCFYSALTLRHAVLAVGTGDSAEAVNCGHVALTSMFQLEQNTEGADFYEDEKAWQRRSIDSVEGANDAGRFRADCAAAGLGRLEAVRS